MLLMFFLNNTTQRGDGVISIMKLIHPTPDTNVAKLLKKNPL